MLGRISGRIVNWQINKGTLKEEERAVYQYAYELLLNQTINLVLAGLIACAFHAPVTVFLFLLSYIPMRSFCGGYHSNTNLGCTIVSSFMICLVCWLVSISGGWILDWYPVAFAVSGYCVMKYAPVPDQNKPLDEEETRRYRGRSRMLWCVEVLIVIIFYLWKREWGIVFAISHLLLSCMMIVGRLKNYQVKSKNEKFSL